MGPPHGGDYYAKHKISDRECSSRGCRPAWLYHLPDRVHEPEGRWNLTEQRRIVLLSLERSHINREAVLHIGLEQSRVGFVDLLDGNDLNIGRDVMRAAKVEHLLGLGDTADGRAGEAASFEQKAE